MVDQPDKVAHYNLNQSDNHQANHHKSEHLVSTPMQQQDQQDMVDQIDMVLMIPMTRGMQPINHWEIHLYHLVMLWVLALDKVDRWLDLECKVAAIYVIINSRDKMVNR